MSGATATDPLRIHKQWATLIGAQNGITTSHMLAGGLIGAHAFLRTNSAYQNLQGKLVAGIGAVALTYASASVAARQRALQLPVYTTPDAAMDA